MPETTGAGDARAFLASLELFGIKLGLDHMRALVAALGHPERSYRAVAVAGTNGKGSTAAMIERGLRAAGWRTGRYTSPHLVRIEERVAVDGTPISTQLFDACTNRVELACRDWPHTPSFFEATTAVALDAFRHAEVQVAILEVGLGGRLDATNAVEAHAAAITAIDFDHQVHLGHTLEAIATEKAGIIKPGALVVMADNPPVVERVVKARAAEVGARYVPATEGVHAATRMVDGRTIADIVTPVRRYERLRLALRGRHQVANAITAIRLLESTSQEYGTRLDEAAIRTAVEEVVWPGRLEAGSIDGIDVLIDGAHNPAGASALAAYLQDAYGRPVPMVIGAMSDKDVAGMLQALLPLATSVAATRASDLARTADPAAIAATVAQLAPHCPVSTHDSARAAVSAAARHGSPVVIAGSLYLAGRIRAYLS